MSSGCSAESAGAPDAAVLCPHFGECGGCQSQDVAYADQLGQKARTLEELFLPFAAGPVSVRPSPVLWHYRNKVDPSFAGKYYPTPPPTDFVRETVLGFKKRWYWPIEIEECRIGPQGLDTLLASVRRWYRAAGLRAYDNRIGTGLLRHLLVRDAKRTDERMVVLITHEGDFDADAFVRAVLEVYPATSIQHGINRGVADVAVADELRVLHGAGAITERLDIPDSDYASTAPRTQSVFSPLHESALQDYPIEGGAAKRKGMPVPPPANDGTERRLHFRISPFSFFQTNPAATEGLYGAIRAWVRRVRPDHLYDLYGGSGGIAFSCADLVQQVSSVETVASASADGRRNAALNNVENVEFITDNVKNYLLGLREGKGMAANAAAIVDPARSGMHPKERLRLRQLAPAHLLYVSCNPKVLAQELPEFIEDYTLEHLQGFDLFPHTRHVEVVAALRRR